MMAQVAFDTLSAAKRLEEDFEFSPKQAEGAAKLVYDHVVGHVATKGDLDQAVTKLDAKIDTSVTALQKDMTVLNDKIDTSVTALNDKIDTSVTALNDKIDSKASKADVAEAKAEVLKWMFGALFAQTGIILAVVKLL